MHGPCLPPLVPAFRLFFHPPTAAITQSKTWQSAHDPKDHRPKGPSLAKAGLSRQTGWRKLKYPSGRQSTLDYGMPASITFQLME